MHWKSSPPAKKRRRRRKSLPSPLPSTSNAIGEERRRRFSVVLFGKRGFGKKRRKKKRRRRQWMAVWLLSLLSSSDFSRVKRSFGCWEKDFLAGGEEKGGIGPRHNEKKRIFWQFRLLQLITKKNMQRSCSVLFY